MALFHYALFLQEALAPMFDYVLKVLFQHLDSSLPRSREYLCTTLSAICENMSRAELRPYVGNLMTRLVTVV